MWISWQWQGGSGAGSGSGWVALGSFDRGDQCGSNGGCLKVTVAKLHRKQRRLYNF
jgi:hypothetical protein